jgi:hypothetical protein
MLAANPHLDPKTLLFRHADLISKDAAIAQLCPSLFHHPIDRGASLR